MKYRYRSDEEMKNSGVEWIGKIPKNWEIKKLKYITFCEDEKRIPLSSEERGKKEGKIPYWGANSIIDYIDEYLIDYEVILIGEDGAPFFDKYKDVAFYSNEKIWPNNHVHILKARNNMNPRFIVKALNIVDFKNYIKGSTRDKLTQTDMKEILIQTPFIKEQNKIANFLDKKTSNFDSIISKKEKSIEKLEEAKKSLISEVVTGKVKVVKNGEDFEIVKRNDSEMKDSGVEWIGKIPKDWEVKRLRFLGKLQNGISKSSDEFGYGYPFVSYSNAYKNIELPVKIEGLVNSTEDDRRIYSVKEGDVLFTRTSETVEEIGFASTCMNTIENATFAGFLIRFRPNNPSILYKGFSKYYFRCELNRKFFVKEMNLVTRASLSQNLLNNLSVVLPSYNEQVEIYNALELKVGGINLSIDKLKYQIEKLKEAKQALISEAVTGKIEILY